MHIKDIIDIAKLKAQPLEYYSQYSYKTPFVILAILSLAIVLGSAVTNQTDGYTSIDILLGVLILFTALLLCWAVWAFYFRWWLNRKGGSFQYKEVFILISMIASLGLAPVIFDFIEYASLEPVIQMFTNIIVFILDLYILAVGVFAFSAATGHTTKYILGGYLLPVGIVFLAWFIFGIFFSFG